MFEVSESFLLEDVTDPVAVSVFANTDDCDLANDNFDNLNDEYEDSLEDTFDSDDSYYDGNEYGDMTTYSENTPEDLIDMDCVPITFGNRIMRVETVPIFLMSVLTYFVVFVKS